MYKYKYTYMYILTISYKHEKYSALDQREKKWFLTGGCLPFQSILQNDSWNVFKIHIFLGQIFQISGIDFQLPDLALNELAESVSFSFK